MNVINKNNNRPFLLIDIKMIYALSSVGIVLETRDGRHLIYPNYTMCPWTKNGWAIQNSFKEMKSIIKQIMKR